MIKLARPNKEFQERARMLRQNSTLAEVLLWNQLKHRQLAGLDFDRQKPINNRYIVDFFCVEHNAIVEIDGSSHDDKPEYDQERHDYLSKLGFSVIHVSDMDVKAKMADVLEYIKQEILKR